MAGVRSRISLRKIRLNAMFISPPKAINLTAFVILLDPLLENSRHFVAGISVAMCLSRSTRHSGGLSYSIGQPDGRQ